jgi:hypothetical protein
MPSAAFAAGGIFVIAWPFAGNEKTVPRRSPRSTAFRNMKS